MERIRAMLGALQAENRDDLRSFILSVLETMAPKPNELRQLAELVSIERIRGIDDPEILITDFNKVETSLRQWAEVLEILHAHKK